MARSRVCSPWRYSVTWSRAWSWGQTLLTVSIVIVCGFGIGHFRGRIVEPFHELRLTSDVYALPAPEQAVVTSLGYRAAMADLLYAQTLVTAGFYVKEKRRFEHVGDYLDVINALDPKFRTPYYFADTLLTLQSVAARPQEFRKAREIVERGMQNRPYDGELWNNAGQFIAYLAAPHMPTKEEQKEWEIAGAKRMARACELLPHDEMESHRCLSAAGVLSRRGQRAANVKFLERVLAVSDNEEIRAMALASLKRALGDQYQDAAGKRISAFRKKWSEGLTYVSKDLLLLVGPGFDSSRCAGLAGKERGEECASTWWHWGQAHPIESISLEP